MKVILNSVVRESRIATHESLLFIFKSYLFFGRKPKTGTMDGTGTTNLFHLSQKQVPGTRPDWLIFARRVCHEILGTWGWYYQLDILLLILTAQSGRTYDNEWKRLQLSGRGEGGLSSFWTRGDEIIHCLRKQAHDARWDPYNLHDLLIAHVSGVNLSYTYGWVCPAPTNHAQPLTMVGEESVP